MNLHDIGVVQRRNKPRFALETGDEIGIGLHIGVELLNGNVASQLRVESLPDFALPTACQALSQFVFAKTSRLRAHSRSSRMLTCFSPCPYIIENPVKDVNAAVHAA